MDNIVDSIEDNEKLYYYIEKLPPDIKILIYKEYFEPKIYNEFYLEMINHELSKKLNGSMLRPIIPIIISKKNVLEYICKKCVIFRNAFIKHKNNNKTFKLMTKGDSLTMHLLFSLYH